MKLSSFVWGACVGAVLAAASAWLLTPREFAQTQMSPVAEEKSTGRPIAYWVAPMDPNYRRDKPGKSPMGMDLVPVYEDEQAVAAGEVKVSPAVVNNLGVALGQVQRSQLKPVIAAFGVVGHNEDSREQMTVRTEGWVENLQVFEVGEQVTKGQKLFDFYSPELLHAQDNYLSARNSRDPGLIRGALGRMRALAIPEFRIRQLDKLPRGSLVPENMRTLPYVAPRDGHLAQLKVRDGSYLTPSEIALEMVSIDSVWVVAEVFERHLSRIRVGQQAVMTLDYFPGQRWEGQVEYIYPTLDAATRSQRVRLRFDNKDHRLKPNMFARVEIISNEFEALTVPRQAVIRSAGGDRVVLGLGDGRFRSVAVETGWEVGDRIVIREGLEEGQQVVVSGQFLLDSESSLEAEMLRMDDMIPGMEGEAPGMDSGSGGMEHGSHSMESGS
ncbi:efflux RND transporter periplasmic adaptor subunit [Pseudomaricurvus sp. HS19]|uniref:efflux RND transporter periplasmic adaptor subunit n=1 Tax=Pseudomaricurvus sp. HS19 TaxID=2692626 RepID=UPI00136C2519|nr:efflux RND transporter periplasmic adaptor subunit [Pseudomaricurvus sp. HS19]MYM61836.1 efflux RND transporter periplasmic adaptor subunit [Pseudomaricurvus sp. HS19]